MKNKKMQKNMKIKIPAISAECMHLTFCQCRCKCSSDACRHHLLMRTLYLNLGGKRVKKNAKDMPDFSVNAD